MGRVNLDLTFRPELTEDGSEDHTVSYLLLCLLLIEIMSHSGPEVQSIASQYCKLCIYVCL